MTDFNRTLIEALKNHITLLLPLAKGYAYGRDKVLPVNQSIIEKAEAIVAMPVTCSEISGDAGSIELYREEEAHARTVDQRDRAQDAADEMASLILGENIDWAFHDAKWAEAIEKLQDATKREAVALDEETKIILWSIADTCITRPGILHERDVVDIVEAWAEEGYILTRIEGQK